MSKSQPSRSPSSPAAWTTAILVVAISLLSAFTLSDADTTSVSTNRGLSTASGSPLTLSDQDLEAVGPLAEGETVAIDESTGEAVVVDSQGKVVRRTGVQATDIGGGVAAGTSGSGGKSKSSGGSTSGGATGGGSTGGGSTKGGGGTGGGSTGGGSTGGGGNYTCPKNAGATDQGVKGNEIKFAATVVRTGIAKSFLADAQYGMEAVRVKQNRAGGVCGRIIQVQDDDDQWNPYEGQRLIEKYISAKAYFGLAVNPSSEGLRIPISSGLIRNNQFPVVGADGMLIGQYKDPWVWPVATSTLSVMHIMARDAVASGATTFGIVYEKNYRFGVEGSSAFIEVLKRLLGKDVPIVISAVDGGQNSYRNPANKFIGDCSNQGQDLKNCAFIAVLLEPSTAAQWARDGGLGNGTDRPDKGIGAAQPLFVTSFVRDCGKVCANMRVWTSFKPPLPPFDSEQPVATYRNDLRAVSTSADAVNPHVEGAYQGMLLLIDALKKLGPAPTRQKLREVLDSTTLDTGLAPPLHYSEGNHFAAVSAQPFIAVFNGNSFVVWRKDGTFLADPEPNVDHPAES